jgi:hypothetical protein
MPWYLGKKTIGLGLREPEFKIPAPPFVSCENEEQSQSLFPQLLSRNHVASLLSSGTCICNMYYAPLLLLLL